MNVYEFLEYCKEKFPGIIKQREDDLCLTLVIPSNRKCWDAFIIPAYKELLGFYVGNVARDHMSVRYSPANKLGYIHFHKLTSTSKESIREIMWGDRWKIDDTPL